MKIIKKMQSHSIAEKVNRVLLLVLATMVILIVAYFGVAKWLSDQAEKQNGILNLQVEMDGLYLEYLSIRQIQSEYLVLLDKKLPANYSDTIEQESLAVQKLLAKMPSEEARSTLKKIQTIIAKQNTRFSTIVGTVSKLGKGQEKSVSSVMLSAAKALEKNIENLTESKVKNELLITLFSMKNNEKNFSLFKHETHFYDFVFYANKFNKILSNSLYSDEIKNKLSEFFNIYRENFEVYTKLISDIEISKIRLAYLSDSLADLFLKLRGFIQVYFDLSQKKSLKFANISQISYGSALIIFAIIIITFIHSFSKDIISGLGELVGIMGKVNNGDLQARTNVNRQDELGQVGKTFNLLLDEKIADLNETETQNSQLNESIINLIQQVGHIANQKDFTKKVPVAVDVTGAVSDSVNLLVQEVSVVLREVVKISSEVEQSSQIIVFDSQEVVTKSQGVRSQVEETSDLLEKSVEQMANVSEQSNVAASWADNTITQTQSAFEAVTKSVENINNIRDTISETEKRIKRLGDRSQEITGIVNLINNIAERTHILALNASMHAASAGEAGRGFAVVADEVQRLAENAREATAEISTLVNNIHIETTDTVTIMNKVISEVADGTRVAREAGKLMMETKVNTTELVSAIKHIAEDATSQAEETEDIRSRIQQIEMATQLIDGRLSEQKKNTEQMERFASQLADSVSVFTLAMEHK